MNEYTRNAYQCPRLESSGRPRGLEEGSRQTPHRLLVLSAISLHHQSLPLHDSPFIFPNSNPRPDSDYHILPLEEGDARDWAWLAYPAWGLQSRLKVPQGTPHNPEPWLAISPGLPCSCSPVTNKSKWLGLIFRISFSDKHM